MAAVTSLGLVFDTRLVMGDNPWIKPIKFDLSFAIYFLTIAWIMTALPSSLARKLSVYIAALMWIELAAIYFQAARAVPSHFNDKTLLDGIMYGIMGLAIVGNTAVVGYILYFLVKKPTATPVLRLRAFQYGLVSFLVGSILGGYSMVIHGAHTVGAPDGGPGLPFLKWSTVAGDLRIAHFIGLHGIQILVGLGIVLESSLLSTNSHRQALFILKAVFVLILLFVASTFILAAFGTPLS
ncbi:MAG TPA: hypothetical protein VM432_13550 [Bdellovibrionales bacterium]|nr:hypothetical protein [Bdellovibrionales bacterium]